MAGYSKTLIVAVWGTLFVAGLPGSTMAKSEEWGKVSEDEWNCPPPSKYPTVEAVVLFDNGQLEVSMEPARIRLERHVRIKIFNKNAADAAATVELPFSKGDRVVGLKAQTILRDGRKIPVKDFFNKKAGNVNVTTFTFPAIEDGAILEYTYLHSHQRFFSMDPWYFQSHLYTSKSCFAVALHPGFTYNVVRKNVPREMQEPKQEDYGFAGERAVNFVWDIRDIMPIKEEPLSSARQDNLISLQFQLTKYENPYGELDFTSTWEELGEESEKLYEEFLGKPGPLKAVADSICAGAADDQASVKRLYVFVHDQIETRNRSDEDDHASDLLRNRYGEAYEKNLLLVGLLRTQGISAYPVVIGTRDEHVAFNPALCQMSQFNRVICYIGTDDSTGYPLDPGDEEALFPFPGVNDIVQGGLLVDSSVSRAITFKHIPRKNGVDFISSVAVRPDGSALCSTSVFIRGYSIAEHHTILHDSLSQDKIAEHLLGKLNVEYTSTSASFAYDAESDEMIVELVLELPKFATVLDSTLFLTPCYVPLRENPFTSELRVLPVDFKYPFSNRHGIRILLPEGWSLADKPPDILHPVAGAVFSRQIADDGNRIEIKAQLDVTKAVFGTHEYGELKRLFDKVTASSIDQLAAVRDVSPTGNGQ